MAGHEQRKWWKPKGNRPSLAPLLPSLHSLFWVVLAEPEWISVLILAIRNGRVIKYRCVTADCMSVCVCECVRMAADG